MAMRTQWRHSFNGCTGLDYGALREVWARTRTAKAERDDIFTALQIMEATALKEIHRKD